jgi:myo-inositol-1(or 4)-monophosphatase
MLAAAEEMARGAGEILMGHLGREHQVTYKGEIDIVTEADRAAEEYLAAEVSRRFPDHGLMAEEGSAATGSAPYTWVIDPLDGTTNFAHGFPFFCVSIALVDGKGPLVGVVHDPTRPETFTATRGGGAFLNGRPLRVSTEDDLGHSLLATGFPYHIRQGGETNLDNFAAFAVLSRAVRRAGSAALDLCYVAAGRFEGYWELVLRPWDMAAGALVVTEAGGRVTDVRGGRWSLESTGVLASNGPLHPPMLEVLAGVRGAREPARPARR